MNPNIPASFLRIIPIQAKHGTVSAQMIWAKRGAHA